MGHSLPSTFAYPEMLHVKTSAMFNENDMNEATVTVIQEPRCKVNGTIAALIDKHGVYHSRVGSLLFTGPHETNAPSRSLLPLERTVIAVPSGWKLHIKVDMKVEISNDEQQQGVQDERPLAVRHDLKQILSFIPGRASTKHCRVQGGHLVLQVGITWGGCMQQFPAQLGCPVEVVEAPIGRGSTCPVYTIGDAMSFTEFIMALRRILPDYRQEREDILDGHEFLNLSSTREHPLLVRAHAEGRSRWIQVKLKVVAEACTTTLLMRRDTLYVDGFMNQHGTYGLYDDPVRGECLLSNTDYEPIILLSLGVSYASLLEATEPESVHPDRPEVVRELGDLGLGRGFAMDAVRVLSSYPHPPAAVEVHGTRHSISMSVGKALAGLIFMICESARTNPVHNYVACGWSDNRGFAEELMNSYVWDHYWGDGSHDLREWKRKNKYLEPDHRILGLLQDIYLVRDGSLRSRQAGSRRPRYKVVIVRCDTSASQTDDTTCASQTHAANGNYNTTSASQTHAASGNHDTTSASQTDAAGGSHNTTSASQAEAAAGSSPAATVSNAGDPAASNNNQSEEAGDPPKDSEDSEGPTSHDNAQGRGRPRVELLAMRAKLPIPAGTKIIIFDGKRGQIVYYSKGTEDKGEQGMGNLLLTGPYTGISAEYGCFTIRIDVPGAAPVRLLEWDCDNPEYANEVGALADRDIKNPDGGEVVAHVTYAVMSNAREGTVQVKLRLKDGQRPSGVVSGKITAFIDGFQVPCVLFKRAEATDECFSPTDDDDSWYLLNLARSLVAVSCGKVLQIEVDDLEIEASVNNHVTTYLLKTPAPLTFENNGIRSSQSHQDDGNQVQVNITWYPEVRNEEVDKEKSAAAAEPSHRSGTHEMATAQPSHLPAEPTSEEITVLQERTTPPEPSSPVEDKLKPGQIEDVEKISQTDEMATARPTHRPGEQTSVEIVEQERTTTAPPEDKPKPGQVVEAEYIIGDGTSFTGFITRLRGILANHPDAKDILDGQPHDDSNPPPAREHPLLAELRGDKQPARWIHVKLQVKEGGETKETTLVVRDDNVCVLGFSNQKGEWFELGDPEGSALWALPKEQYNNPKCLNWGVKYSSILQVRNEVQVAVNILKLATSLVKFYGSIPLGVHGTKEEAIVDILNSARLGKNFAMDAVHTLSRFQQDVAPAGSSARLALLGLTVMVCQSARMNPLRDAFAAGWNNGTVLTKRLMGYMMKWDHISRALLNWKNHRDKKWTRDWKLRRIGIKSAEDALRVVHLVLNDDPIQEKNMNFSLRCANFPCLNISNSTHEPIST